jgi:hypothetical protein
VAELLILEFEAPEAVSYYKAVNERLGLAGDGSGDWPPVNHHLAGESGNKLVVVEVWESKADQEEFMNGRLGAALAEAKVPAPTRVEWFTLAGEHHSHG